MQISTRKVTEEWFIKSLFDYCDGTDFLFAWLFMGSDIFLPTALTRQTSSFNTRQVSRLITCDVFEGLANTSGNIRYTTRSYSGLNAEKIFLSPGIPYLKKTSDWFIFYRFIVFNVWRLLSKSRKNAINLAKQWLFIEIYLFCYKVKLSRGVFPLSSNSNFDLCTIATSL